ncbi:hypothetical protein COC42_08510 [Sphingomonas spermidinifaciens]|uniref:Methyltransferase domain-containing protein n=1 Tax=Sphingomonas spermidinifaciens TaxID=1141889 RepID=A0A2A4B6I9_9SPHN|nr:hypothetical protein COC42_08510 [Sphingomonas spermidinifaciens]
MTDGLIFFGRWLRDPAGMASIAPSGQALAELITRDIGEGSAPVLELGSGTGAFVPALLARGLREADLVLVERDACLARRLAIRYPGATVLACDAAAIPAGDLAPPFAAAVCGLGLLNLRAEALEAILLAVFARMAPGAAMYLFTYGRRCSVPDVILDRLSLVADRRGRTWRNLPPATVYRLRRRLEPTASRVAA